MLRFNLSYASSHKAGLGLQENERPISRHLPQMRFSQVFKQRKASLLGLSLQASLVQKRGLETVSSTIVLIQQSKQLNFMFNFQ